MKRAALVLTVAMFSFAAAQSRAAQDVGIAGRVTWSDGTAAAGVRVTAIVTTTEGLPTTYVVGTKAASTALTDNAGRYRIANLPAGRYHVVTGPVSFPRTFSDVAASNSPHLATVTPGKTFEDMNFTIVKDYSGAPFDPKMVLTVTGKIVRGIYNGSAGTHVVVTNSNGSISRWQMRASDSPATRPWWPGYDNNIGGEIDKMSRAGETVTISGNDSGYTGKTDFRILYVHEVTRGGVAQTQAARVQDNGTVGTVVGSVLWSDGAVATGARVTAIATSKDGLPLSYVMGTRIAGSTLTDNAGHYRIENLPAGLYHIVAGPVSLPRTFSDVAMIDSPHLVTVTGGKTADGMNFTIVRNSEGVPNDPGRVLTITGKMVLSSPAGFCGIHIMMTDANGTVSRWQFRQDGNSNSLWWWPGYDAAPGGEIDKMSKAGEIVTVSGTDAGSVSKYGVRTLRIREVTRGGLPQ